MRQNENIDKTNSPNNIRRLLLHTGWITPVVSSAILPVHANTSQLCSVVWSNTTPILAINGSAANVSRTITVTNTGTVPLTNGIRALFLESPFTQGTSVIAAPGIPDPLNPGATHVTTVNEIVNILPFTTGNLVARYTFAETTCVETISVTNQPNT